MENKNDMLSIEKKLYEFGYDYIAGVDEAGRGPLAGPVVAACVVLPKNVYLKGVDDSKKLSEKKREELFDIIRNTAIAYSIEFIDEKIIDEINILNATFLAMKNAVYNLSVVPQYVLIDGNMSKGIEMPFECIVKGDSKSQSIAAASILAKVARDRYMKEIHLKYPDYNFLKHKGYGTKEHIESIKKFGVSDIHRKSFLTKII